MWLSVVDLPPENCLMCWLWNCSLNINSNTEANISKRKGKTPILWSSHTAGKVLCTGHDAY